LILTEPPSPEVSNSRSPSGVLTLTFALIVDLDVLLDLEVGEAADGGHGDDGDQDERSAADRGPRQRTETFVGIVGH